MEFDDAYSSGGNSEEAAVADLDSGYSGWLGVIFDIVWRWGCFSQRLRSWMVASTSVHDGWWQQNPKTGKHWTRQWSGKTMGWLEWVDECIPTDPMPPLADFYPQDPTLES